MPELKDDHGLGLVASLGGFIVTGQVGVSAIVTKQDLVEANGAVDEISFLLYQQTMKDLSARCLAAAREIVARQRRN